MINYGYFRHRLDASSDPKIQKLLDESGMAGLGYYFTLLEIYGSHYNKKRDGEKVKIHIRIIASAWRKRSDYCWKTLRQLHRCSLVELYNDPTTTLQRPYNDATTVELDIPNFPKYFGSYQKKPPNKRKEKKIKEKVLRITPDEVRIEWNKFAAKNNFKHCVGLGSGKHLQNFFKATEFLPNIKSWLELFDKCNESDFLKGNNDKNWKVDFLWLVDFDNALKILNGNFENNSEEDKFKAMMADWISE